MDSLYLKDYGRWWGEKMTMSVGASYLSALGLGSTYGAMMGIRKGGATTKLMVNSTVNAISVHGPPLANSAAVITGYYVLFVNIASMLRGTDDTYNSLLGGFAAGGLYKVTSCYKAAAKYALTSTIIFTGIDAAIRQGWIN
eukprot:GHVL01037777.1.p1 GENE.GHVL01037777.1~~GHVL01037777.1.p1  ORF type:complete len:141 (+),score=14.00 GHVL01037777.1:49-471(+)